MLRRRRLASLVALLSALACGSGDSDGGGTETDVGTEGATTPVTHGSNSSVSVTVTNGSQTFTNTSDPTTDPTGDPSSSDPSTSGTDDDADTSTASPDSSDGGATTASSTSDDGGGTTASDTGAPGGTCCEAHAEAGCGDAAIEACVCEDDDFCCRTGWDDVCTVQVVVLGCGECPGIGGDGDCCAAHGNPGCDDAEVEACVCTMDYVCCLEPWDELCVDAAADCGAACE
ncbi:MAG TPA: hypothetical protein VFG69_08380 [Nannocystaceae bacterium]|nr:hypothetical protein [Nannocystaceae bacterium]